MNNESSSAATYAPDDLKEKAGRLKEHVGQTASLAKEVAGEGLKTVKNKAGEVYRAGVDKAAAMKDCTVDYVRENPLKTVLIAAGIGAVAGMLLARRR